MDIKKIPIIGDIDFSDPDKRARYDRYGFEDPMAGVVADVCVQSGHLAGMDCGKEARQRSIRRGI